MQNNNEILEKLQTFTDLLYEKDNKHYHFYYNNLFKQFYLGHSDTLQKSRLDIYSYFKKYLKHYAEFSMWECTHSQVDFKKGIIIQLDNAITMLNSVNSPYIEMRTGQCYELSEDLVLDTRINAKSGAVIKIGRMQYAYRLSIVPISGEFALTMHSSFFDNSTKNLNGDSNTYYELNVLMGKIGIESFENKILYDTYHGTRIKGRLI